MLPIKVIQVYITVYYIFLCGVEREGVSNVMMISRGHRERKNCIKQKKEVEKFKGCQFLVHITGNTSYLARIRKLHRYNTDDQNYLQHRRSYCFSSKGKAVTAWNCSRKLYFYGSYHLPASGFAKTKSNLEHWYIALVMAASFSVV